MRAGKIMRISLLMAAALGVAPGAAAAAQAPSAPASAPAPELVARSNDVLTVLRGGGDLPAIFAPGFLAQVPPQQIAAIGQQLTAQYGAVQSVEGIAAQSSVAATIRIGFARAIIEMNLRLEDAAPHLISGLLVTNVQPRGTDSADALIADLRALPGHVAFAIVRLGDAGPQPVAQLQPDQPLAIGSAFKLVILGELTRQIAAGRHRWDEVVPLNRRSLPSGMLQAFPQGAPLTIHSLAALMISISDNSATDTLLSLVGRENVERMMATMGMASAARNRPFLSTLEAFAIKLNPDLLAAWSAADEAGRRRLLAERVAAVRAESLDAGSFTRPQAPDRVEWFASAADLVRMMDWLRRNADPTAQAILAINPGLGPQVARDFAYLGFKGGSEPGVITLTFLVRNRAGQWLVVTGGWNNPAASVDDSRFIGLMSRALQLVK
jgi:beta-lactamase class A